jgi:galactokinase/mevalonate kinase-like predicted kinase
MENNKSITAVEWLEEQFKIYLPSIHQKGFEKIIEQAKEMESKKNQKFDEMLEMLKKAERTLREVYECENEEIKQLIKEATEL